MKSIKRKIIIILLLNSLLIIIFYSNLNFLNQEIGNNNSNLNQNNLNSANPVYPININDTDYGVSDWETVKSINTWISGSGTSGDPYIIEDIIINASFVKNCITIVNSRKFFIIRNTILHSFDGGTWAGISLNNVSNGKIIENDISNPSTINGYALKLVSASGNEIVNNFLTMSNTGIILWSNSSNNKIQRNHITNNYNVGIDSYSSSQNIIENNEISNNFKGIDIEYTNNSIVNENIILSNSLYGIYIDNGFNNSIEANIIKYQNDTGIYLNTNSDNNSLNSNFIYSNIKNQVYIKTSNCNNTTIINNLLISNNGKFIEDFGNNTFILNNTNLFQEPALILDIKEAYFSENDAYLLINITSSLNLELKLIAIQIECDNKLLSQNDIMKIQTGIYKIILEPFNDKIEIIFNIESLIHETKILNSEFTYNPNSTSNNENNPNELSLLFLIGFILLTGINIGFLGISLRNWRRKMEDLQKN